MDLESEFKQGGEEKVERTVVWKQILRKFVGLHFWKQAGNINLRIGDADLV